MDGPVADGDQETAKRIIGGLTTEAGLLRELRASLLEQREAIANDDPVALEGVIQQIGRTLVALGETRRERVRTAALLSDGPVSLVELATRLQPDLAASLRAASQDVHHVATSAARDLAVNQAVLRRAIETGEASLQRLLTLPEGAEPTAGYGEGAAGGAGLLLNQRA